LNHIDTGCVITPSQSKWLPKSEMTDNKRRSFSGYIGL